MRTTGIVTVIVAALMVPGKGALAASVGSDIVYEKVDMFSDSVHFTDNFTIGIQGTYKATLTDFQFPNAFTTSGLDVTTGVTALGRIDGPGSFTFDAGPGNYYVGMFASVGEVSAEQKNELIKADLKKHARERSGDLTEEEKQKRRERRKARSEEEKAKAKAKAWARAERRVDEQLASQGALGQYGVQISMLATDGGYSGGGIGTTTTVVPLPGAVWMFGAGLVALLGFGRRSASYT